ncbi:ABC transporter substrate-binding protein [Catelliglobosispora koreensis]|uniref:ABC transporter substrate-binding protein n=1 Tax=Catelliglobosispora koreensis TaxID=129052 RepID=UPI00037B4CD3|nr:extracellular solute-binding protein [Catelliglobosispora koreensis]
MHRAATSHVTTRRSLLLAALAAPVLAACGTEGSQAEPESTAPVELSVFWWGAEARAKATEEALKLYTAKYPFVTFKTTWQGNQGYYDKLATMAAGGNAPDIFQIDDGALSEYGERGVTLDLTPYKANGKLDVSKFPESLWKYGEVDGKLAGVPTGENTPGMIYNKQLCADLGVPEPTTGMSWDALISWGEQIYTKSGGKVFGTMDPSADYKALWMWLRQQGKELYKGKAIGASKEDLVAWFKLWQGARDRKAAPSADIIHEANGGDVTKQLVVTGKAATSFLWANQITEVQKLSKQALGVVAYPGNPSAQWARAALYFSIARSSTKRDRAVDVVNFLVNSPEVGKLWGADRGLSANLDVRKAVADGLTDATQKTAFAFETDLAPKFGQAPPVPPKGHVKARALLITHAESVQYGKATPEAAAEAYLKEANAAIAS